MTDQSIAPNERDIYYAKAAAWADDREASLRLSRRIAWLVAGVAAGIAILEAVALTLLTPLKTVVPYTLLVDRQTGFVQPLRGNGADPLTADWALVQSLLAQYVIAREGFDIASIASDYRKVALWSGDAARSDYLALMPANNPASPFRRYPRTAVLSVQVKSVSPLSAGSALVRFDTDRRDQDQTSGTRESWVSVVRYRFSGAPMAMEDRLINPLGFQVVHYRRDQEAPAPVPVAPAAPTVPVPAQPIALPR
jgi:type IV secretion system protein VirB8